MNTRRIYIYEQLKPVSRHSPLKAFTSDTQQLAVISCNYEITSHFQMKYSAYLFTLAYFTCQCLFGLFNAEFCIRHPVRIELITQQ